MTQTSASPTSSATLDAPYSVLFGDIDNELKTTRRILERVPDGKDDWRPHAKSKTLGELATHIAQLPGLGIQMLTTDVFEASSRGPGPKPANSAERVEMFDEIAGQFRDLLEQLTWDQANAPWTLMFQGREAAKAPRAQMVRSALIMHLAHHRAQLGVYLRLLDIPVPSSYGPTADEGPAPR